MRNPIKRSPRLTNWLAITSSVVLVGGSAMIASNASGSAKGSGPDAGGSRMRNIDAQLSAFDCPEVGTAIPESAQAQQAAIDRALATIDVLVAAAKQRYADNAERAERDPAWAREVIMTPLRNDRLVVIRKIVPLIEQRAGQPLYLEALAPCTLRAGASAQVHGDGSEERTRDSGVGGAQNNGNSNGNNNGNGNGQNNGNSNGNGNGDNGVG